VKSIATVIVTLLAIGAIAAPSSAATWYIKSDGSGDAADIQAAIDAASNGDTVLLASGTFTGTGNYDIDFSGKAVVLMGEFGPSSTTIDCQTLGQALVLKSGEGPGTIITGLTIKNAYTGTEGGAIMCDNTSPQIIDNVFEANHTEKSGGGIYVKAGSPLIQNNTFVDNLADVAGGGIFVDDATSSPQIIYNIIAFSAAGEGIACSGGANPIMSCNDLYGNAGGDALCGTDGGNNASSDPEFCGVSGSGFFWLQSDSPCAPASSLCGVLIGSLPVACSTVDIKETSWGAIKALFE